MVLSAMPIKPNPKVEAWMPQAAEVCASLSREPSVTAPEILAIVHRESGGDPSAVSISGFRGLGQVGRAVCLDYNDSDDGAVYPTPIPVPLDKPILQLRITAWFYSWCKSWAVKRGYAQNDLESMVWGRVCYGWGPGNLKRAVKDWRQATGLERVPSLAELADMFPQAGRPYVRPWLIADTFLDEVAAYSPQGQLPPIDTPGPSASEDAPSDGYDDDGLLVPRPLEVAADPFAIAARSGAVLGLLAIGAASVLFVVYGILGARRKRNPKANRRGRGNAPKSGVNPPAK